MYLRCLSWVVTSVTWLAVGCHWKNLSGDAVIQRHYVELKYQMINVI